MKRPGDEASEAIAAALRAYGFAEVRGITPVAGDFANQPHVVTTEVGRFFVKVLGPTHGSPLALARRHAYVDHLVAKGRRVPRLIGTRTGEPVARESGGAIEVQEYVKGQPLRAEDPDDAARAGEALARMHLSGADFVPPGAGPDSDPWGIDQDLERLRRREQQMQTYLPAPEVTQSVQELREGLTAAGGELTHADLPAGMVHGDVRPQHFLRDAVGEVWVTGLDRCRRAPLLVDVSALAHAFGDSAVTAYERLRTLTDPERRLAPTAIRLISIHSRI